MIIDVKPDVRNLLLANQDLVTALGGESVYSVLAPDGVSFPYITLQEVGNQGIDYADNAPERAEIRIQVDVWSDANYSQIVSVVDNTLSPAPWAQNTAYAVNQFVANGSLYQCTTAGTSAPAGIGPRGSGASIMDGTVEWKYVSNLRFVLYYSTDLFELDPRVFHKPLRY
jgi:hypothetical protein